MTSERKDIYDKDSLKAQFTKSENFADTFKLKEDFEQLKKLAFDNQPKIV